MGDLFHEEVPFESIDRVFAVMALASRHTFLLLTKRSRRMLEYLGWSSEKPDIIGRHDRGQKIDSSGHIGEYICGFTRCRWPIANVHTGVTVENGDYRYRIDDLRKTPAAVRFVSLEPMLGPMGDLNLDGIHWVIARGESGPNARPAHPDWFRKVRDDCAAAGVPFFLKQVGPTKVAGRLLDGREHNELPGEATLRLTETGGVTGRGWSRAEACAAAIDVLEKAKKLGQEKGETVSVYDVKHCPHCGGTDIHSGEEDVWTCYACQHRWGGEQSVIDRLKGALLAAQNTALLRRQALDEAKAAAKACSRAMSEAHEREDRDAEKYADVERALFAGETDRCDHETLCREIRRLAQEVPGVGIEPFPRQPRQNDGWTIHTEYLKALCDWLRKGGMAEHLSWEEIEAVLLAVEAVGSLQPAALQLTAAEQLTAEALAKLEKTKNEENGMDPGA